MITSSARKAARLVRKCTQPVITGVLGAVRQRALQDGRTVHMAVPRLAEPEPFFLLDPDHLADPPRKAASIAGATRSARRVAVADLEPVDLVVTGCVAVGTDGARLGKGGGSPTSSSRSRRRPGWSGPRRSS